MSSDSSGTAGRIGKIGAVAATLLGSAFTMTLMACYGCPANDCPYAGGEWDAGRTTADAEVDPDSGIDSDAGISVNDAGTADGSADASSDASNDAGALTDGSADAGD